MLEAARARGPRRPDALLRRAPWRRSAPAASASSASRARPGPIACVHDAVPRRHGRRHARRDARAASPARSSSSCSPSCPSAPRAAHRARRGRRATSASREPRWRGAVHARATTTTRHPYLAFQHELCISCGRCVRACDEVQGTFALTATGRGFGANVAAGLDAGLPRLRLRLVRRVRRHLSDRRDHRDLAAGHLTDPTEVTATDDRRPLRPRRHDDLRLLRRRLPPGGARRATAASSRSARRSTVPPTRATPA